MCYNIYRKHRFIWIGFVIFWNCYTAWAQDTIRNVPPSPYNPDRAAIYSAILPGTGQVYVKKYWKVPIIYVLGAGTIWTVHYNHKEYKIVQRELEFRNKNNGMVQNEIFKNVSSDALRTYAEERRRYRDLFAIVTALIYVGNIIDAYVDAHLATYDISDDLSLKFQPILRTPEHSSESMYAGISLTIGLNKRCFSR
ncbi:MAG: DUF5683 domain-containing protein [Bacteroidia bacterium]|nr:DUF5683 domain-containing protein [Bacteroidia bacterium]MDW8302031.1 DUF5683 domain-containing protein [Bacteroidia bacterium]